MMTSLIRMKSLINWRQITRTKHNEKSNGKDNGQPTDNKYCKHIMAHGSYYFNIDNTKNNNSYKADSTPIKSAK